METVELAALALYIAYVVAIEASRPVRTEPWWFGAPVGILIFSWFAWRAVSTGDVWAAAVAPWLGVWGVRDAWLALRRPP